MSNLTIAVDDEIIKRARVRAIQQGTSVSAKLREFLQLYVDESEDTLKKQREESAGRLMQAIEAATAEIQTDAETDPAPEGSARSQRKTLRDDLYAGDFRAKDRKLANSPKQV